MQKIQHNTIQFNTIQYSTIQFNTIRYNTISTVSIMKTSIASKERNLILVCYSVVISSHLITHYDYLGPTLQPDSLCLSTFSCIWLFCYFPGWLGGWLVSGWVG